MRVASDDVRTIVVREQRLLVGHFALDGADRVVELRRAEIQVARVGRLATTMVVLPTATPFT